MTPQLIRLSEDLRTCRNLESFWDRISIELAGFGIKGALYSVFAFPSEADPDHVTRSSFIKTNYGREFLDEFGEETLLDHELTATRCLTDFSPIIWHDESGWAEASLAQRKRMYIERDMGLYVGVTLPAPLFSQGHHGGIGLSARDFKPGAFEKMWQASAKEIISIAALLDAGMRREHLREIIGLSPREKECLTFLAAGLRPDEIADRLHISYKTIEKYVEGAKKKLKAGTRDCAVAKAMLFNLIAP